MGTATSTAGSTPVAGFGYGYNAAGERTQATLADGSRWAYGYDGLGQLTSASRRWAGDGSQVAGQQYGYKFDGIGNRTQATVNGRAPSKSTRRSFYYPPLLDSLRKSLETVHNSLETAVCRDFNPFHNLVYRNAFWTCG